MRCVDDCHTYILDFFGQGELPENEFIERDYCGRLHFYEMREDGHKIDGVTNEEVLRVLIHRLRFLNETCQDGKFWCVENSLAITNLEEALLWLEKRTADREARKVEGTHKP